MHLPRWENTFDGRWLFTSQTQFSFLKKEKTNGDFNPLELLSVGILDSSFLMDLLGSHKDGMGL